MRNYTASCSPRQIQGSELTKFHLAKFKRYKGERLVVLVVVRLDEALRVPTSRLLFAVQASYYGVISPAPANTVLNSHIVVLYEPLELWLPASSALAVVWLL